MKIEQALAIINYYLEEELSELQRLILEHSWQDKTYQAIAADCGYSPDYIREHGAKLWRSLSAAMATKVTKKNCHRIVEQLVIEQPQLTKLNSHQDWSDAIDVSNFCGRSQEIATLEQWVIQDGCCLVGILGIGGVGKTSLAIKFAQQVADRFDCLIWRSLKNAPSIEQILLEIIHGVWELEDWELNSDFEVESTIAKLIIYLKSRRCLLILDNVESILQNGSNCGHYQSGYEDYGKLFQSWGEIAHQSCLILTSREKSQEFVALAGKKLPVHTLQLSGLDLNASQAIFAQKGDFFASEPAWQALVNNYRGNPLAFKIIATIIEELFEGCIDLFLEQNVLLFDDLENILTEQFERLSDLELEIMYWLAIERETTSITQLQQDLLVPLPQRQLLEAVKSLSRRSLIEQVSGGFTQQPVVMEYASAQLLKQVTTEIETTQAHLLISHALIKAEAQEHLRLSQNRITLQPLAHHLIKLASPTDIVLRLQQIVQNLRGKAALETGYAVGNIINLLRQLKIDLNNYDFSRTHIRQAYLANVSLHNVKLTHTNIQESVFAESLDLVFAIAFNPQGTIFATGSFAGEIYLWQMPQGRQILCFAAHQNWVQSFKIMVSSFLKKYINNFAYVLSQLFSGSFDGV